MPKNILVILPGNLGDVIMCLPVLQGLKAKHEGCSISFFVENGFEAGLHNSPWCDEIIRFSRKEIRNLLNSAQWLGGVQRLKGECETLAARRFDLVINLCQHTYISFIAGLAHGTTTLGQRFLREGNHAVTDTWSRYLYAIPFSRKSNALHATDVYRRIAGVSTHDGSYGLRIMDEEKQWAGDFLAGKGIDLVKKIMIFQAGAAFPSKTWTAKHFIALGNLLTNSGWQIVLTGALAEKAVVERIFQGIQGARACCAGETTFRQSMALCSLAKGCVTGDTAQMHAAAGLGVTVYALFGSTSPVETGPYGNGHWIFSAPCTERPCFKDACETATCMKSILPEVVFKCIMENTPGKQPGCDVYRTSLVSDGDYSLEGVSGTNAHYDKAQALLTRRAFGDWGDPGQLNGAQAESAIKESIDWTAIVKRMAEDIDEFLKKRGTARIKDFEMHKATLTRFQGIGAFWTAALNLGLNGIPLLDPLEGVKKSRAVCEEMIGQIGGALKGVERHEK